MISRRNILAVRTILKHLLLCFHNFVALISSVGSNYRCTPYLIVSDPPLKFLAETLCLFLSLFSVTPPHPKHGRLPLQSYPVHNFAPSCHTTKASGKKSVLRNEFLKVSGCGNNTVTEKIGLYCIQHTAWV